MRAVLHYAHADGQASGTVEIDDEHGPWWPKIADFVAMVPNTATWYCTPVGDSVEARELVTGHPQGGNVSHPPVTTEPPDHSNTSKDVAHMSDAEDIKARLKEPFPTQVLGTLNKGGTRLTYVPIAEVIVRLNDVFGVNGWSSEIVKAYRDPTDPDWVLAHVRLTATINDVTVSKDAYGGQPIKRTSQQKTIVDLGDEFKGAVSDALKKAAQQFGIGIELARKDEALRWDAAHEQGEQAAAPAAQQQPAQQQAALATEEERKYIVDGIAKLIDTAKQQFREWWKENKLPKPEELNTVQYPAVKEALDLFLSEQEKYLARKKAAETEQANAGGMNEDQAAAAVKDAFPGAQEYPPGEEPY